jgi:hypothetical protein
LGSAANHNPSLFKPVYQTLHGLKRWKERFKFAGRFHAA